MPGLRTQAETDLGYILEGDSQGFRWPITVTDPQGNTAPMYGFSDDISQIIDPETGQAVSGRLASVALRISSLTSAGLALPENVSDDTKKPWVIDFNDINGNPYKFKVSAGNPDRALGVVVCNLEIYE